jgi:hypothetical protein
LLNCGKSDQPNDPRVWQLVHDGEFPEVLQALDREDSEAIDPPRVMKGW